MEDKIRISYPNSEKVYLQGVRFPNIRVGMRKVNLTPTVTINDKGEQKFHENAPVFVYDTSGPYSDPNIEIDLKKGLPRMREQWILDRGDVEQLEGMTSEYGRMRQPLRQGGKAGFPFQHTQKFRQRQRINKMVKRNGFAV